MTMTASRWAAVRALMEGAPPAPTRISAVTGVHLVTLSRKGAREGWRTINWRHAEAKARHAEVMEELVGKFPTAHAGAGDAPWKSQPESDEPDEADAGDEEALREAFAELDGASPGELAARMVNLAARSAARILVRAERRGGVLSKNDADTLGAIARFSDRMEAKAGEQRAAQGKQDDEEHAAVLEQMLERVFSLAYELADEIVADRDRAARARLADAGAPEPTSDCVQ